jgi:hypothetical protein
VSANADIIERILALTGPHTQPAKFRAYLEGRPRPYLEQKLRDLLDDDSKLRLGRVHLPHSETQLRRNENKHAS